jgi:type II secretory pathway pseudopilin PulG
MPTRLWLHLIEILLTVALAAIVLTAWRADRRDRAKLAADLAVAKQALAQTDARQHDRDAQLAKTLATLAAGKRTVTTPAQIVRALPNEIPLPVPISLASQNPATSPRRTPCSSGPVCGPEGLESTQSTSNEASNAAPAAGAAADGSTQGVFPTADLKPLYDFALDCKACQSKLAAAQADLTDERAKAAILTRERNEAVRVAKGGSLLQRITRNAKWLAIGAAAGAIAAKAHR